MKKLLLIAALTLTVVVVCLRGDSLMDLIDAVKQASIAPLLGAVAFQLGKYFLQSLGFSQSFSTVGLQIEPKVTITWVFGSFFMNTILPSIGVSGMALIVDDASRRGLDAGKAASGALLMQIAIDSGFFVIMLVGFGVLIAKDSFNAIWIFAAFVALLLIAGMIALLVLGYAKVEVLRNILRACERAANRILSIFKKGPIADFSDRISASFSEASHEIALHKGKAARIFIYTLSASACEMACFYFCALSFGVSSLVAVIGGYVLATLLAMVSITPQGMGFVEAGSIFLFKAVGISMGIGTAITLLYRGLCFWMPFAIGAILINATKTFKRS